MINNINTQKSIHNIDRNLDNSKTVNIKSANTSAVAKSPAVIRNSSSAKSAASLATSAGLHTDKLSSSIISFARFFSLPLKPEMLAAIRRQALCAKLPQPSNASSPASSNSQTAFLSNQQAAQNTASMSDASSLLKMREALSLAAAAAESKGVELNIKGFETYADAIDPDWQKQHGEENQHNNRDQNKNDKEENKQQKENEINADMLKKIANEFADNNQLIDILNRLPSKNGMRWIVLPFEFFDNGKQYTISMRVLLENENRACKMAMQITVSSEYLAENSEQLIMNKEQLSIKKWNFGFEFAENQIVKLIIYLHEERPAKDQSLLKNELSKAMDIPIEKILVKCSNENFPCEMDCNENYISIDEAM